jgi:hypothetical protein
MDQALHRFNQIDRHDGLILSLDADTIVENNYFQAIENKMFDCAFENYGGCIINFEHPIEGNEFNKDIYKAIIQYELYLRYYKYALKFTGFPFYHYTIGSCFGIRAGFYAQQGGMNRQKGGEDFYFLHKLFPHRPFVFINGTCVHPSPRFSNRVPFGTGPIIANLVKSKNSDYMTYSFQAFIDLKEFFSTIPGLYKANSNHVLKMSLNLSQAIQNFLNDNRFIEKIQEINSNSASIAAFTKRFFQWFDGFRIVKYLNFVHTKYYDKIQVVNAIKIILEQQGIEIDSKDEKSLLLLIRKVDLIDK